MSRNAKTHVFRNRDKKDLMGINRGRKVAAFPLPADYTVTHQGNLFFAEVKSTSDDTRFNYSQVEAGQRSAAGICTACDTPYWFFIHSLKLNRWFQLPGAEFVADIKAGIKSRRFEDLAPCTFF